MTEAEVFVAVGLLAFAALAHIGNEWLMAYHRRRRARERAARAAAAE